MKKKIIVKVDPDLKTLIPGFLENRQADILSLKTLLQQNDFEGLKSLGHILKGVGSGYGFDPITEIGAAVEDYARQGDAGQIQKAIQSLEEYLRKIEITYE